MSLLTAKSLWAIKEEGTPGTVESLAAANVIKAISEGQAIDNLEAILFDDFTMHHALGVHPKFAPGIGTWSPTLRVALAGHNASDGSSITKLPFGHLIEACGFEALDGDSGTNTVEALTIGTITNGPFQHGEVVTAASGEAGVVIGDTWTGTVLLYVEDTAGAGFANGTITGATSGASATISASSALNPHVYRMLSDPDEPITLTTGLYTDGKLLRAKGCRGSFVLTMDHANRPFLDFTFRGAVHNAGTTPHEDAAFPTGVTYTDKKAPASLNVSLALNDGSLSLNPNFNTMRLDIGNELSLRENTNSASGYDSTVIVGRNPTLTVNPDEVLSASYPFLAKLFQGLTTRGRFTLGSTAGNRFTFIMPFLATDALTSGNRENVRNWDGTFNLTKGSYTVSNESSFGADNELVIIHS